VLVAEQYASEANLRARQSIYARQEGPDARAAAVAAVAEAAPRRVLEVGGGQGEIAEWIVRETGAELVFLDLSPRMVELARARGLDAQVGDVQELPFADGEFDCAVAAWMLYHVADLDRGIGELARVLRPGGRLVAVTNGEDHLRELRALGGWWERVFTRENGADVFAQRFSHVERWDLDGWTTIEDDEAIWAYLRSLGTIDPPAELPPHELPLRVRTASTVFVATK
jgi:ubiquinone/menaquinone biosynthesis C-methylase UbiE